MSNNIVYLKVDQRITMFYLWDSLRISTIFLQALIGKSTSKETVYKVDLFAQFIDPFLSFSEKSLAFTILKVRIDKLIQLTVIIMCETF